MPKRKQIVFANFQNHIFNHTYISIYLTPLVSNHILVYTQIQKTVKSFVDATERLCFEFLNGD